LVQALDELLRVVPGNGGWIGAFELKEAIRGSHSMRMVGDDGYPPRIKVMLVTLDVDERPPLGNRSAIADGRRFVLR
jgi:hypothetical protein